jgi:hypothetical protein
MMELSLYGWFVKLCGQLSQSRYIIMFGTEGQRVYNAQPGKQGDTATGEILRTAAGKDKGQF